MHLQESGEMYLETILIVRGEKPYVRSIDVANQMGYSKPSISRAISLLRENGYLEVDAEGHITLTKEGEAVAESIYDRHRLLTGFLTAIGVNAKTAAEDACKIEHDISDETYERLREHAEKLSES